MMADAVLEQRLIGGVAAIVLLFLTVLAVLLLVATVAAVARAVRRYRRAGLYDGADQLRLLEDLDAHLDEYVAEDPDLWDAFGRGGNWDIQARLDRLRQAIRDEQQKGDQA